MIKLNIQKKKKLLTLLIPIFILIGLTGQWKKVFANEILLNDTYTIASSTEECLNLPGDYYLPDLNKLIEITNASTTLQIEQAYWSGTPNEIEGDYYIRTWLGSPYNTWITEGQNESYQNHVVCTTDTPDYTPPWNLRWLDITDPIGTQGSTTALYFGTKIPINFTYWSATSTYGNVSIRNLDSYEWQTFQFSTSTIGTVHIIGESQVNQTSTTTPYIAFFNVQEKLGGSSISTSTNFSVVNNEGYKTPFDEITQGTLGTTTLPNTTNLLSFLNVPELLKTKIPFGYIFQIVNTIKTSIQNSTSTGISSGTIYIKLNPNLATTTIDFFSETTIRKYLPQPYINLFRGLEIAFIWFECVWFIYHDAKNRKII